MPQKPTGHIGASFAEASRWPLGSVGTYVNILIPGTAFRNKAFQDNVRHVFEPLQEFAGRFGAVRLVIGDADVCSIDHQYPKPHLVNTETKRHKAVNAQRLWSYVAAFIDRLSHGCLPMLLLVFIKFVLLLVVQMRRLKTSMAPSCDNFWNDMCTVNTYRECEPTYYETTSRRTRVNYICLSQSKSPVLTRCYVHPSRAFRLQ